MIIGIEVEVYKVKPSDDGMYITSYRGDNLEKGVEPRVRVNVHTLVDDRVTEDLRVKLKLSRDNLIKKFNHSFEVEKDMWIDFINRSFAYTDPFESKRLETYCKIHRWDIEDKTLEQSFNEVFYNLYIQASSIHDFLNKKGSRYSITIEMWASKNKWEVKHSCPFAVREIRESEEENQIKDKWVKIIAERIEEVKDRIVDVSKDLRLYGNTGWKFAASTGWSEEEMNNHIDDWINNYLCKDKT